MLVSELLFRHTYLCAVWKWYMVLSFREVKECGPSSLNNISSPVCPGPVLMTSSLHRNALKQKAARGRAHFISRSFFLSHSIPISFWKDPSIIYPPFPLLGKNSPSSSFVCVLCSLYLSPLCSFLRHSSTLILIKQAALLLLFILTVTDFGNPLRVMHYSSHGMNDTSSHAACWGEVLLLF